MYTAKVLLPIAALAGSALSQKSNSEFCASQLSTLFSLVGAEAPTTPAAIASFIATNTHVPQLPITLNPEGHQSQLCAVAEYLPSSLLPEFQTLASGLMEFGKAHSSDFIAYVTDCTPEDQVASTVSYLNYVFSATDNICQHSATPTPTPGGSANGTYPTATPTITSAPTSLIPTAAAARPTGAILGAAAGVLGAAALL